MVSPVALRAVEHDAQRQRLVGLAVVQHVGELELALLDPVDRGQQDEMGEALHVAQFDEERAQLVPRRP